MDGPYDVIHHVVVTSPPVLTERDKRSCAPRRALVSLFLPFQQHPKQSVVLMHSSAGASIVIGRYTKQFWKTLLLLRDSKLSSGFRKPVCQLLCILAPRRSLFINKTKNTESEAILGVVIPRSSVAPRMLGSRATPTLIRSAIVRA